MVSEKEFTGKNFQRMLEEKVSGTMLTPAHWKVPSTSTPNLTYDVQVEDRDGVLYAGCRCKAGCARKPCKHGLWVLRQVYFDPRLLAAVPKRLEVAA